MLTGNLVAICLSGIVCIAISLANPDDYDWESTRQIRMVETSDNAWYNDVDYNEDSLAAAKSWIMKMGLAFTVVIVIVWPVLSLPAGVFSEGYFDFWVRGSVQYRCTSQITRTEVNKTLPITSDHNRHGLVPRFREDIKEVRCHPRTHRHLSYSTPAVSERYSNV